MDLRAGEQRSLEVIARADQLPAGVQRMHKALVRAVRSGRIEKLRDVLQMSELMPLIDGKFIHDPIKYWKDRSRDQHGYELLAQLSEILELPPVKVREKSGELYIWPYFARMSLDKLSPRELVRLYRLVPASKIAKMLRNNRYSYIRVTFGADGTWHSYEEGGRQAVK